MPETIQAVERRLWWPSIYIDESMPEGRATPDAWLCRLPDGAHGLGSVTDEMVTCYVLSEGKIINFECCDSLGTSLLVADDEGNCIWLPEPPATTNHFQSLNDVHVICDTVEDFEEWALEYGDRPEEVRLSRWPLPLFRCRFTAEGGPPRFVPLDPVPAGPADAVAALVFDETQNDLVLTRPPAMEA